MQNWVLKMENHVISNHTNNGQPYTTTLTEAGRDFQQTLRQDTELYVIIYFVMYTGLMFPIIIGNILVILSYRRYRELQTVLNKFILNLAINDMLVGTIAIPLATMMNILYINSRLDIIPASLCPIWKMLLFIPFMLSATSIVEIAIILWISIQFPLQYKVYMTKSKARIIIIFTWIITISLNIVLVTTTSSSVCYYANYPGIRAAIAFQAVFYFLLFVMIVLYSMMLRTILQANRRNEKRQLRSSKMQHFQKKQFKSAKFMLNVIGSFILCWIPNCIRMSMGYGVLGPFGYFCLIMLTFGSAMNPAIYAAKNLKFRIAFKNILTCSNQQLTPKPKVIKNHKAAANDDKNDVYIIESTKL